MLEELGHGPRSQAFHDRNTLHREVVSQVLADRRTFQKHESEAPPCHQ